MDLKSLITVTLEIISQSQRLIPSRNILECFKTKISKTVIIYFIYTFRLQYAIDELKLVSSFESGKVNI